MNPTTTSCTITCTPLIITIIVGTSVLIALYFALSHKREEDPLDWLARQQKEQNAKDCRMGFGEREEKDE